MTRRPSRGSRTSLSSYCTRRRPDCTISGESTQVLEGRASPVILYEPYGFRLLRYIGWGLEVGRYFALSVIEYNVVAAVFPSTSRKFAFASFKSQAGFNLAFTQYRRPDRLPSRQNTILHFLGNVVNSLRSTALRTRLELLLVMDADGSVIKPHPSSLL